MDVGKSKWSKPVGQLSYIIPRFWQRAESQLSSISSSSSVDEPCVWNGSGTQGLKKRCPLDKSFLSGLVRNSPHFLLPAQIIFQEEKTDLTEASKKEKGALSQARFPNPLTSKAPPPAPKSLFPAGHPSTETGLIICTESPPLSGGIRKKQAHVLTLIPPRNRQNHEPSQTQVDSGPFLPLHLLHGYPFCTNQ